MLERDLKLTLEVVILNFYDFMDRLDRFTIENADEYDFRDVTVSANKIGSFMFVYIKHDNEILEVIAL